MWRHTPSRKSTTRTIDRGGPKSFAPIAGKRHNSGRSRVLRPPKPLAELHLCRPGPFGQALDIGCAYKMRSLLSRVEDVFQIADRGCVVAPGIPRSSDARIKIGDSVWLTRPDGSETNTAIRGIEMGGRDPDAGNPILLGSELTKDDVPLGTLLAVELLQPR
jgi:hypothetical protein